MRYDLGRFRRPMRRSTEGQLVGLVNLGDGSTLSLDFTTGVLDPRLTFTRSTTGTFIGANGLVQSAAINTPRFDHDPTAIGTPRGLLIEGSANNLVVYSNGMATSGTPGWSGSNITRTANTGGTAPDGTTNTATKFRATSGITTSTEYIHSLLTGLTSGATYTFSLWAKADGAEWIWVSCRYFGVDNGSFFRLVGDGELGNTTGTIAGKSITKYPNGWYRITVSHVLTGSTVLYPFFIPCTSNGTGYSSILGQTPDGVLCWGGQVETGSGASSYIPTGASTGNRAFDSCVMEDITSCNYSTKTGTLFYAGRFTQMNVSSFPNRVGFTRETGDLRAFYALSTTTALLPGYSNGATSVLTTQNITLNSELKLAISFDADLSTAEVKSSLNGAAIVQSGVSALTESNAPTYFMIGQKGYGAFFPHGTVRSVKYWPTTLPNAQLQALTT